MLETTHHGRRYVVVLSTARERRDTTLRLQLIAKVESQLLALERRVQRGDLVAATDIAAVAATILARSQVKQLFDVSHVAEGRFVYDYNHEQLDYDEQLAGHYVLSAAMKTETADAARVLAAYRSLQSVEQRFRWC